MNLAHTLTQAALKWPNKTALVFEGRRWTYAQWNRWVNKTAHAFRAAGIGKGDRVAILTYNLPEQVTAFYALMKIGAVPVPINYRLAANEVKYIVDDSRASILVFEEALRAPVEAIKDSHRRREACLCRRKPAGREIPFDRLHRAGRRARARGRRRLARPGLHHVHLRHHRPAEGRGALAPCRVHGRHVHFRSSAASATTTCILNNKPLFHIAQLQLQFIPFVQIGATNVHDARLRRARNAFAGRRGAGHVLHGVPTQMVMMVAADLSKYDLSLAPLRLLWRPDARRTTLRASAWRYFPGYFANVYGSTEALTVTCCDYRRHPDKLGSVGKASIGHGSARHTHRQPGSRVICARRARSVELITRGPSLLTDTSVCPSAPPPPLRSGWFLSGDAAVLDDEGFITVMGRMDHTIKSGGENIHPSEVENVLFKHPGIANAAVVGLPSRKWGQVVCAAIVRRDPALTAEMLDRFCRDSPDLADFKRPRHYFFVDEIPANPTGKVERGKLKDQLTQKIGGRELD